jgi:hypothetical protein
MANPSKHGKGKQPLGLDELAQTSGGSWPEHLREDCEKQFLKGQQEVRSRGQIARLSGTPSSQSTTVATVERVPILDPRVSRAMFTDFKQALYVVGTMTGSLPDPGAMEEMAQMMEMADPAWTMGELLEATALISNDHELAKACSYAGSVTPAVFSKSRENWKVKRGRLLDHREAMAAEKEGYTFKTVQHDGKTRFTI